MSYSNGGYRAQYYVDGNAVREIEIAQPKRPQPRGNSHKYAHDYETAYNHAHTYTHGYARADGQAHAKGHIRRRKKQQVKAAPMNMRYVSAMIAAILIACVVLMGYVKLQSDITNHVTNISKLESQLYELQLSNDEYYTKIMSSVDLEEIKRIAITELGMKYAKEGQVVNYTGEGSDYVRQFSEIPGN